MTRLITRVNVDINNANWLSHAMSVACSKEQGITRAMRRAFDWICWGTYIRFIVKLAPYKITHPQDALSHEYSDHQYLKFRENARNRTVSVDEEDDDTKFRLLNDYQFQLRLIDWAERLVTEWRRETVAQRRVDRPVTDFDRDLAGRLSVKYTQGHDAEGQLFYIPEFKLEVPLDWENYWTVKNKQRVAELLDWMANQIENMYEEFAYNFHDELNVAAQRILGQLAEEAEAQLEAHRGQLDSDDYDPVVGSHLDIDAALA